MPIISAVGKRSPQSTTTIRPVVLDDRHVLADLADASQREDAQLAAHRRAVTPASRPWRASTSRTRARSASSHSTSGSRRAAGVMAQHGSARP